MPDHRVTTLGIRTCSPKFRGPIPTHGIILLTEGKRLRRLLHRDAQRSKDHMGLNQKLCSSEVSLPITRSKCRTFELSMYIRQGITCTWIVTFSERAVRFAVIFEVKRTPLPSRRVNQEVGLIAGLSGRLIGSCLKEEDPLSSNLASEELVGFSVSIGGRSLDETSRRSDPVGGHLVVEVPCPAFLLVAV